MVGVGVGILDEELTARPTEPLPLRQLGQIALYWLGINAIMGGIGIAIQKRVPQMVPAGEGGTYLAIQGFVIVWVNILVQPTIGMISDYTHSRWGRRKPYIAIGATLDVVFLIGVAYANTYVALVAFLLLLQFSSNFAQGPFQGYVPDLVPASQVGLASGLVGLFSVLGNATGFIIASLAVSANDFTLGTLLLGVVEVITMLIVVVGVNEGRAAIAPSVLVADVAAALMGIGTGSFLAVDWALMTDIIPKASSGRYMGISNVATASAGVLAVAFGGAVIMDHVPAFELGPRFA